MWLGDNGRLFTAVNNLAPYKGTLSEPAKLGPSETRPNAL